MDKKTSRLRRAKRTRMKIRELRMPRLSIMRTPRHMYAQLLSADGSTVIASASTVEKTVAADVKYTGNIEAAAFVGKTIAARAQQAGVVEVAFDRSGFLYHGRVKALADAAREAGLKF
jgi:large subunit ribosomal protein L18